MADHAQAPEARTDEHSQSSTSLADRIGLVVGGQFVSAIIGLLQGILIVRWLDKASYGTISLIFLLQGTARDLGMLYLPESLLYFAPKASKPELLGLIRQTIRLLVVLGGVVAVALALFSFAPGIFLGGRTDLGGLLLLAGLVTLISFPTSVYGSVFIATDNHRRTASVSLLSTVLGAIGSLVPAALGWPVWIILASTVVTTAIRLVLSEHLLRQIFAGVSAAPFPGGLRKQLDYVLPISVTRFAGLFNQKLDKFIVGLFFKAESFAEFAIGSQELPLVSILPYTIASTMTPKLVELYERAESKVQGARDAVALWHAGMRKASLVMVPVGVFLLVSAEHIMMLLYGEKYRAAALPFRIYSALLLLRITGYGTMLMAFGLTREVMRIQILGMVVNVALSFLLLPRIGMIAAPLAAVLTQTTMIVVIVVRVNSVARLGALGIFPWSHWLRTLAASSIAGALVGGMMLLGAHLPSAVLVGASLPLFLVPYVALAQLFGVLAPEDRAYVARWIRLEPLRSPAAQKPR